ncbi:MAG: hypothetical protein HQM13_00435 [SAR324 cluster bacterium]|nr:hypothetical protein [SAR324 cluster bacterium]
MNILSVARSFSSLSFEISMLAKNGSVHAARVNRNEGQSMVPLVDGLAEISRDIGIEIETLKSDCILLSRKISICSIAIKRYYLYTRCLAICIASTSQGTEGSRVSGYPLNSDADDSLNSEMTYDFVESLSKWFDSLSPDQLDNHQKRNMEHLALKSRFNRQQIETLAGDSIQIIENATKRLTMIERSRLTMSYIASSISINTPNLKSSADRFMDLVENTLDLVHQIEKEQDELVKQAQMGKVLLKKLLTRKGL